MNILTYEVKRAHWSAMTVAARRFKSEADRQEELKGMTPARYEMLACILKRDERLAPMRGVMPGIALNEMVTKLGLNRTTISKGVRRMEKIGFVVCKKSEIDGRCTIVEITLAGLKAMAFADALLGIEPNFVVERARYWLGLFGRRTNAAAYKSRSIEMRFFARIFGSKAHPIFDPSYDHLWPNVPNLEFPRWDTGPVLPQAA